MKIVNVYNLLERLEQFYDDDSFISYEQLECIFNEVFECENELSENYIK